MAKALMLWPAGTGVRIGSAEAARLGALGVTNVTLLRDALTVAVLLEGWAFSPARSVRAAAVVLGDPAECRVLQPALDVAVSNVEGMGGIDEEALARIGRDARGSGTADR
ncbi:MAG: hypothetical protein HYX55_06045 [Chloroflexi bacterium]|nr:hypothetical protein [Chloroflexota bacterium]